MYHNFWGTKDRLPLPFTCVIAEKVSGDKPEPTEPATPIEPVKPVEPEPEPLPQLETPVVTTFGMSGDSWYIKYTLVPNATQYRFMSRGIGKSITSGVPNGISNQGAALWVEVRAEVRDGSFRASEWSKRLHRPT